MKASKLALSAAASALVLGFTGCDTSSSSSNNNTATPPTKTVEGVTYTEASVEATTLSWADTVALPAYDSANVVEISSNIATDTTWDATKQYKLVGEIKVTDGATLTIPAGTVVFGDEGANYMVVLKGSKLIAEGTATSPITFTSLTALNGGTAGQGQWGGLTILGDATTNHTGAVYEVDEDDTDFVFGGTADTDNSGSLKYVRILNSGYTVATDLEINGLSLCGVGSGTTVENIYVENSSDDGIEIWGGTVNLSDIEIVNAGDDSFDLDYGYTGTVTNLTVEQASVAHAGMEISSGGTEPMTSPVIKNFKVSVYNGSDEGGIYIKDDTTAPTFENGVVTLHGTNDKDVLYVKKTPTTAAAETLNFTNVVLDSASN